MFARKITVLFMLIGMVTTPYASDPSSNTTHAQQLKWFQEQRFGMFIHWGPVSQVGGELSWSRGKAAPPVLPYDTLYKTFNPTLFDAGQWVKIAEDAGMKYMVFTAKHHDGFCMFNTALTDYKITAPDCPFGRDICKELADSCHAAGMGLGFYYSPEDWYWGSNATPEYHTYYTNQVVDELLSNYGRVDVVWYDLGPVGADKTILLDRMRQKQPWVLVSDRGEFYYSGGDFKTPEQKLGAFDTTYPWESCMTMDGGSQWSWNPNHGVKPLRELIGMIVGSANAGGNCLLNVGPRPDGTIDSLMVSRLMEIGDFMKSYGESIYGTRGGPIPPGLWGGTTHKNDTMYVHLKPFASSNLAKGKNATQSSTAWGGEANRALDDNSDGIYHNNSVSHTNSEANAWWMVDLGGSYSVNLIKIYGRTDCCMDRMSNYDVIILDSNQTQVWSANQSSYPDPVKVVNADGQYGRYVKIQLTGTNALSLAEVQVFDTTRNSIESVTIPPVNAAIVSCTSLTGGTPLIVQDTDGITISLPVKDVDTIYTILRMILDYSPPSTNGELNGMLGSQKDAFISVHPNPWNPMSNIDYSLPTSGKVHIAVFDLNGKLVKTLVQGHLAAGKYHVTWNGTDASGTRVAAGVYVYKLTNGNRSLVKRTVFAK